MKSIILITTLLSSITIMAKPICTFKTDSDVKIKLINKEKDSFSTAYTKFNHRLVQGQEGVETREFAVELSHHIDHYRTIFKILVDENQYIYEHFLGKSFFNKENIHYTAELSAVGNFIQMRGVENPVSEPRRAPHMKVKSSARVLADYYRKYGVQAKVETHFKAGKDGDNLFKMEWKDLDIEFDCQGKL